MRRFLLVAPALMAGCSTAPAQPIHGIAPGRVCNAAGTERFIGMQGTSESGSEILKATNSAVMRWAPPGAMMTMDYSASRVTVHLDKTNKITAINCG